MPLFFERGVGSSTNIDSTVPKRSITTQTAARKFSAPDLTGEQQEKDVIFKSNDEHLIEQAASIKSVALVADSIAATARDALAVARAQVSLTPGEVKSDVRPNFSSVTDIDVDASRNLLAQQLAEKNLTDLFDVGRVSKDLYTRLPGNVFLSRPTIPSPPSYNPIVPDLGSVSVEMDRRKGTIDCFYSILSFSVPQDQLRDKKLRLFRIFRATVRSPVYHRGLPVLSMQGVERLSSARSRFRSKNLDTSSQVEQRLSEDGILNSIGLLNPVDPSTNVRISANSNYTTQPPDNSIPQAFSGPNQDKLAARSFVNSPRLDGLSPSVAGDLNILKNIERQDPAVAAVSFPAAAVLNLAFTRKEGLLNPAQTALPEVASVIVDENNAQEFREIATLTIEKLKARSVGNQAEYQYLDETIGFGKAYRYYITSVDSNMIESGRSRLVEITVEGIRVPPSPGHVIAHNVQNAVALHISSDDQLIEKFEVFRKELNAALINQQPVMAPIVAGPRGFNFDLAISRRLQNNFIKVGESLNGSHGAGSTFYDRNIRPGQRYAYRVFSVDVFGNKSERPEELTVYVPDSSRPNDLIKPHLTSEADTATGHVKITFQCTDSRVKGFLLSRRDLTLNQTAFTTPSQVNRLKFGMPRGSGQGPISLEGEVLRSNTRDDAWTGYFENDDPNNSSFFIDTSVLLDHTYQYKIYGVDVFGNKTSDEITKPLLVSRLPMIDPPVNFFAQIVAGPASSVGGINLFWQESNIAVSAEDMLGNRSDLRDSSVRTLYQVERRKVGEERWFEFPLIEQLQFFDAAPSVLGGEQAPGFRPPPVETNQTYVYRVKAVQTGSFFSNYVVTNEIFVTLPMLDPSDFRLRSSDANVKPAYIVLNWNTPDGSGTVDKWEIQRSEVNNVAAARLNPKSAADFQGLSFVPFREVFAESSRFRAQTADTIRRSLVASATPSRIFTGDHQFQDTKVSLGNTYFYRIRAIGLNGTASGWVYRGMKLTDSSFENKLSTVMDSKFKQVLALNTVPLVVKGLQQNNQALASFALQPSFSKPTELPKVQVGVDTEVFNPGGGAPSDPKVQPTYLTANVGKLTGKI